MKKIMTLDAWFRKSGAFKWANRPKYTEKHFEPYVKAIGQLLLAWNDLHERLATLFVSAMGGGWVNRPLAIWHATRSDYSKRQLLRAAIAVMPEKDMAGRPKLIEEIVWILDAADKLEGYRDDSAHTPIRSAGLDFLQIANLLQIPNILAVTVSPDIAFQNPRAIRMDQKNKDILVEYRYARERIIVLRDYAIAIDAAWSNAKLPWPNTPSLPERRPRKGRRLRVAVNVLI